MEEQGKKALYNIINDIKNELDRLEELRDNAIKKSRDIIRLSGKIITLINAGKEESVGSLIDEMEKVFSEYMNIIKNNEMLKYAGFSNNALAEYVEAKLLYNIVKNNEILSPPDLGVDTIPYLLGLADVIGELKRRALEKLRNENYDDAWKMVDYMDAIYASLRELDYPEAMLPGFRHKVDTARKIIEDFKKLLIDLDARHRLIKQLENCKQQNPNQDI